MLLGRRGLVDPEFAIGEARALAIRNSLREHVLGGRDALNQALAQPNVFDFAEVAAINNYIEDFVMELSGTPRIAELAVRIFQTGHGQAIIDSMVNYYGGDREQQGNLFWGVFAFLPGFEYTNMTAVLASCSRAFFTLQHVTASFRLYIDQFGQRGQLPNPRMMFQGPYGVAAPIPGNVRELPRNGYIDARLPGIAPVPINQNVDIDDRANMVAGMYQGIVRPRNMLKEQEQFQNVLTRVSGEVEDGLYRYKEDLLAYKSNVVYGALNALKRELNGSKVVWGSEPIVSQAGRRWIRIATAAAGGLQPIFPISFKLRNVGVPRRLADKIYLCLLDGNIPPGQGAAEEDAQLGAGVQPVATESLMVIGKLGSGTKREYGITIAPYFGFSDPMYTPLKSTVNAGADVRGAMAMGLQDGVQLKLPSANAGLYDRLTVNVGQSIRAAREPLLYFLPTIQAGLATFWQQFAAWLDAPLAFRFTPTSPIHQVSRRIILEGYHYAGIFGPVANGRRTFLRWISFQQVPGPVLPGALPVFQIPNFILGDGETILRVWLEGNTLSTAQQYRIATTEALFAGMEEGIGHMDRVFEPASGKRALREFADDFLGQVQTLKQQLIEARVKHPDLPVWGFINLQNAPTTNIIVDHLWLTLKILPRPFNPATYVLVDGLFAPRDGFMGLIAFTAACIQYITLDIWNQITVDVVAFRVLKVPANAGAVGAPPIEIHSNELLLSYLRSRLNLQVNSIFGHYAPGALAAPAAYPYVMPAVISNFAVNGQVKLWVEGFHNIVDYLKYLQIMSWLRNFGYSRKQEKAKISKTRISRFVEADSVALRKMVETFGGDASTVPGGRRN